MTYSVELSPAAQRQLRKFDKQVARRIVDGLRKLGENPRSQKFKPLKGMKGACRTEIARAYRVVYEIHDDRMLVLVLAIAHRREVYRNV